MKRKTSTYPKPTTIIYPISFHQYHQPSAISPFHTTIKSRIQQVIKRSQFVLFIVWFIKHRPLKIYTRKSINIIDLWDYFSFYIRKKSTNNNYVIINFFVSLSLMQKRKHIKSNPTWDPFKDLEDLWCFR
jgi:hypothetical protein